jgi:GNAT superfamily N-acetyltransferase
VALRFRPVAIDAEPAASLVGAMRAEMRALYDDLDIDSAGMPAAGPGELGPPRGTFLVGAEPDGTPVCCGGVKDLEDGACEIKRMFVAPEARGRGYARELLAALEDAARALGYDTARLDTGPRQPRAEAMYRRRGYVPIANFNGNPVASFFGEKALSRP